MPDITIFGHLENLNNGRLDVYESLMLDTGLQQHD